jgi:hypothetical protein
MSAVAEASSAPRMARLRTVRMNISPEVGGRTFYRLRPVVIAAPYSLISIMEMACVTVLVSAVTKHFHM